MKVKPLGTMLLVELLTANEMLKTKLYVADDKKNTDTPRGYVVSWGHLYDAKAYGVESGDQVLLVGSFVPTNEKSKEGRDLVLVDFTTVKGVVK